MCAKQSLQQPVSAVARREAAPPSLTPGNTIRSGYRVLREAMGRPIPRSVHRDDAGRNATSRDSSVKGTSPVKCFLPEWPSNYGAAKATPVYGPAVSGTPGVQAHGMYRRLVQELGNTPGRGTRLSKTRRQGVMSESKVFRPRVLRSAHSSEIPNTSSACVRKEVG